METTTLNIGPDLFWGLVALAGLIVATVVIFWLLPDPPEGKQATIESVQEQLGLSRLNGGAFFLAALFWSILVVSLSAGLLWVIWEVILSDVPTESAESWDWLFLLAQMVALTGVLGAVIAFPVTLVRIRLTREQNAISEEQKRVAEESLFNDKLKAAADDLHARREIHEKAASDGTVGRVFIEDDIVRRVTAIDRLEGLAEERPAEAPRITRLLCVYLRQMSTGIGPDHPEHPRADMEAAAQAIGRMKLIDGVEVDKVSIELSGANLAGFDLLKLCFDDANLEDALLISSDLSDSFLRRANLQRADLEKARLLRAQMQGARLGFADLERARFEGTQLQCAFFPNANLKETEFGGAKMQDALLSGIEIDNGTGLRSANLRGAAMHNFDLSNATHLKTLDLNAVFGDESVDRWENHDRPAHWAPETLRWDDFETRWRAWQEEIGFDPEDPSTW
jgi:hypothetical protein